MKKILTFIILLFVPFMISAKEYCHVVSGDVNTIGSEIACGDEHFYVVKSNDDSVNLLAKYNLEVGYQYDQVILSESRLNELNDACSDTDFWDCTTIMESDEFKMFFDEDYIYMDNFGYESVDENGNKIYVLIFQSYINVTEYKQSSKALAAHGDEKGKPEFPEYGVVQLHPSFIDYDEFSANSYYNNLFSDFSMEDVPIVQNSPNGPIYLSEYEGYLLSKGYDVKNVDLLSLRDINELVIKLSGNGLPFDDWYNETWENEDGTIGGYTYHILGSIKENIPEGNDWLFNTTYWLRSSGTYMFPDDNGGQEGYLNPAYMLFVDALGNLCMQDACNIALGAGVRPVIEIDKNNIIYNITPETDGNGTLDVPKTAEAGEIITYKVEPKDGYELDKIMIITDSGREIEITEEDVTCDENKVCTIKSDKFIMPEEDIVIRVKFVNILFNPKTGMIGVNGILFVLLCVFISGIVVFKSYNKGIGL